jgi:hypothetical protein
MEYEATAMEEWSHLEYLRHSLAEWQTSGLLPAEVAQRIHGEIVQRTIMAAAEAKYGAGSRVGQSNYATALTVSL